MFTLKDYRENRFHVGWTHDKWQRLLNDDWVYVYRRRSGASKNYNMYKITKRGMYAINDLYEMLRGEQKIPTTSRSNPMFAKDNKYTDWKSQDAIKAFNRDIDDNKLDR